MTIENTSRPGQPTGSPPTGVPEQAAEGRDAAAREYHGKLLERHRLGASENDIRSAFRDFLLRTGIAADESEIVTETRPAADNRNKVDLYLRNWSGAVKASY